MQKKRATLLVLVVFALLACASGTGVQTHIRTLLAKSLGDRIKDAAVELVHSKWKHVSVPDVNGDTSTPIGKVSYSLTHMKIESVDLGEVEIAFQAPHTIVVSSSNVVANVDFNWYYRESHWPHVSDSGGASVRVSGSSLELSFDVTRGSDGRAGVANVGCSVSIGQMDVHLSGGATWIYNLLLSALKSRTTGAVEDALQDTLTDLVMGYLTSLCGAMPVEYGVMGGHVIVDLSLTGAPRVSGATGYMSSSVSGLSHARGHGDVVPIQEPDVPLPSSNTGDAVQVQVSAGALNSAAVVGHDSGLFVYEIGSFPAASPIQLTVHDWSQMVPELGEHFSLSDGIVLNAATMSPPAFVISEDEGIEVSVAFSVDVNVVPSGGGDKVFAYSLEVDVSASGSGTFGTAKGSSVVLGGKLSKLDPSASLLRSDIGAIDVTTTDQLLRYVAHQVMLGIINERLAKGYAVGLPSGVSFSDGSISNYDGYLVGSGDLDVSTAFLQSLLQ